MDQALTGRGTEEFMRRFVLILTGLAVGLLLGGCGAQDPPLGAESVLGPRIVAKVVGTVQLEDIARVFLIVEGEGIDPAIRDTVEVVERRTFDFSVDVPVGPARTFTVQAVDANEVVIFEGSRTLDLVADGEDELEIAILIVPQRFTLQVTPSDTTVNVGDEFEVAVDIYEVEEVFGVSFEVEYDAALLGVVSAEAGDFLGQDVLDFVQPDDRDEFVQPEEGKSEEGRVSVSVVKKRGDAPVSGTGRLAIIRFEAKAAGEGAIRILPQTLTIQQADGLEVSGREVLIVGDGKIQVQ